MADIKWDHSKFVKSTKTKALDGIEECAKGVMLTQAKEDCPVNHGIMRGSLTTERDDANKCVYLGGGGPAKDYIHRQEVDRSLNHTVGKAGFIRDSVEMHAPKLKSYVEKHI
ncbi:MAG: hypothetical protein AB9879_09730 [Methanothrix sp.]